MSALPYIPVPLDHSGSGPRRSVDHHRELFDLEPDVDRRSPAAESSSSSATLEQTLSDIRDYLRLLVTAARSDGDVGARQGAGPSHRDLVIGEWQRVAVVIDRVSFTLFALISTIVTIALYSH